MSDSTLPRLVLVPGRLIALFVVLLDGGGAVLALPVARFLEGLRAARDLMSFAGVVRHEDALDELLPWTGNV